MDIAWDVGSNITSTVDNILTASAGGTGNGLFDVGYTIDDINRVTKSTRGNWSGSGITSPLFDQEWTLGQTGNWEVHKLDLDGDLNYNETGELNDDGAFNDVNELLTRNTDGAGGVEYTLSYDKPGNLIDDGKDYDYKYDVWGRLRTVKDRSTSDLVAEYWYNGLNHRIGWHSDVTDGSGGGPDGTVDADDPTYFFVYDDQWRVIATYRKEDGQAIDSNPKDWFAYHAAGLDGYGGSSYIDATVLRDRDFNTAWHAASDGALEQRRYLCQNWRADVVAILSEAGVQDERAWYSAYGVPFGMPAGDTDSDGDFDLTDQGAIAFWESMSTYDARGDVNLDGSVTSADSSAATTESLGWEALSGIDSRRGYAGYEHAPELAGTSYHVRYRVLKADLGRWLTRDPEGYSDGMSLYAYVQGMAVKAVDPMGLLGSPTICAGGSCTVEVEDSTSEAECDNNDWSPAEPGPWDFECPPGWYFSRYVGACVPINPPITEAPSKGDPPNSPEETFCEWACDQSPNAKGAVGCNGGAPTVCNCMKRRFGRHAGSDWATELSDCVDACESGHIPNLDCSGGGGGKWTGKGQNCSECGVNSCIADCFSSYNCEGSSDPWACNFQKQNNQRVKKQWCDKCIAGE